jgi:hypothetical protein
MSMEVEVDEWKMHFWTIIEIDRNGTNTRIELILALDTNLIDFLTFEGWQPCLDIGPDLGTINHLLDGVENIGFASSYLSE